MRLSDSVAGGVVEIFAPGLGEFKPEQFEKFLKSAPKNLLGLDVEGKHIPSKQIVHFGEDRFNRLRLVQLATAHEAWVLRLDDPLQVWWVCEALSRPTLRFVSHTNFDPLAISGHFEIDIADRFYDTHMVSRLLDPGDGFDKGSRHGLKTLSSRFIDDRLRVVSDELDERFIQWSVKHPNEDWGVRRPSPRQVMEWGWDTIPLDDAVYALYAGLDAIYVRRLWDILINLCREKGVSKALPVETWLSQFTTKIAVKGWRIDREYLQSVLTKTGDEHNTHRVVVERVLGAPALSPKRVDWLTERGVEFTDFTKKGRPSLTAQAVVGLLQKLEDSASDEVVTMLKAIQGAASTQNATTFLTTLSKYTDEDGWVHPNIKTLGAVTGRWSVTEPALQTVSNRNPARQCFVPDDSTHVLLSADQSQAEVRIAAALAQEENLIAAIERGEDLHDATATLVFGPSFTSDQRKVAKRITLGTLYGSGIETMLKQCWEFDKIQVSAEDVQSARSKWRETFPRIMEYSRKLQREPEVWLSSGRFVPQDPDRLFKALNSSVQGTARDVMVASLQEIYRMGYGDMVRMQIHDEVILSVPKAKLMTVCDDVRKAMSQSFMGVPMESDLEVYPERWGQDTLMVRDDGLYKKISKQETVLVSSWDSWEMETRRNVHYVPSM